jgi:hypothetical protein
LIIWDGVASVGFEAKKKDFQNRFQKNLFFHWTILKNKKGVQTLQTLHAPRQHLVILYDVKGMICPYSQPKMALFIILM